MTDQATTSPAQAAFSSMLSGTEAPETAKLLDLFSQLEPVSVDSIIGLWRAVAFGRTPREPVAVQPAAGPLPRREGLGITKSYGKRFVTRDDAEPIVCLAEDGSLVTSIDFGVARLRELAFRGTASAAMVYDQQPWIDYFRKLDDDTVVGMIDMKGKAIDTAFFLFRG